MTKSSKSSYQPSQYVCPVVVDHEVLHESLPRGPTSKRRAHPISTKILIVDVEGFSMMGSVGERPQGERHQAGTCTDDRTSYSQPPDVSLAATPPKLLCAMLP